MNATLIGEIVTGLVAKVYNGYIFVAAPLLTFLGRAYFVVPRFVGDCFRHWEQHALLLPHLRMPSRPR